MIGSLLVRCHHLTVLASLILHVAYILTAHTVGPRDSPCMANILRIIRSTLTEDGQLVPAQAVMSIYALERYLL